MAHESSMTIVFIYLDSKKYKNKFPSQCSYHKDSYLLFKKHKIPNGKKKVPNLGKSIRNAYLPLYIDDCEKYFIVDTTANTKSIISAKTSIRRLSGMVYYIKVFRQPIERIITFFITF